MTLKHPRAASTNPQGTTWTPTPQTQREHRLCTLSGNTSPTGTMRTLTPTLEGTVPMHTAGTPTPHASGTSPWGLSSPLHPPTPQSPPNQDGGLPGAGGCREGGIICLFVCLWPPPGWRGSIPRGRCRCGCRGCSPSSGRRRAAPAPAEGAGSGAGPGAGAHTGLSPAPPAALTVITSPAFTLRLVRS